MNKFYWLLGIVLYAPTVLAVAQSCIQLPSRTQACPHVIYKKVGVDVPLVAAHATDMICLCLSDLKGLRLATKHSLLQGEQHLLFTRMAQQLQLSEQDLITLIRN